MLRYDERRVDVSVFRQPSNNSNGNTVDNQGRLVTCEHLARRVTRTEIDGSISVIADKWQGKRLNSPNDAVVKSDDSIWFTDPAYGIDSDNEGDPATPEIDGCHVYRVDPKTGEVARVIDDMVRPNGLAFSQDEKLLYVADTGASHVENGPRAYPPLCSFPGREERQRRRSFRRMRRRIVRRLSRRPARPHMDEHGRRRPLLRSRRHADRQDPDPRNRRQRDLRRRQAQSPVHLRHDLALRGSLDDQRVETRLTSKVLEPTTLGHTVGALGLPTTERRGGANGRRNQLQTSRRRRRQRLPRQRWARRRSERRRHPGMVGSLGADQGDHRA